MFTLNCKGRLLQIKEPIVMGIINTTPDSFFPNSRSMVINEVVEKAGKMLEDGATILDLGGQSTRPGSELVEASEESDRLIPCIEAVHKAFPDAIISADTFYASVSAHAVIAGAGIINDVSGGSMDEQMLATVGKLGVPYVCMHMRGTPQTMQKLTDYNDLVKEVVDYFIQKIDNCKSAGIHDIILDPGFGFAKTIPQNFEILNKLEYLKILDKPLLIGLSRKGTIWKTLGITAEEALNGTTVLNTVALMKGASILRVHEVKEAMEAIKLIRELK
ncbi:MAG: dihydropteroate synthase [Flavitalea sp.]